MRVCAKLPRALCSVPHANGLGQHMYKCHEGCVFIGTGHVRRRRKIPPLVMESAMEQVGLLAWRLGLYHDGSTLNPVPDLTNS